MDPPVARTSPPAPGSLTRRRLLIAALAVASVAFVALEVRDGWTDVDGEQLPGVGWLVASTGLLLVGQVAIGEALGSLAAMPTSRSDRRRAFHLTQPAKYVPAGIAQAAGVVTVLVGRGASRAGAIAVWIVHTAALILAGVGVGLVLSPAFGWTPTIVVVGLLAPLVLSAPVLRPVFGRVAGALGVDDLAVPAASQLAGCTALAIAGIGLHGLGFAMLVEGAGLDVGRIEAVAAYALAFGVSVATPLPGGLGAREAIIFGLLSAAQAALIVPVVLVRLLLIAIELVLVLVARLAPSALSPGALDARDGGGASAPPAGPR